MQELKPCKWCKSTEAQLLSVGKDIPEYSFVKCCNCGARTCKKYGEFQQQQAAEAWNMINNV